MNFNNKYQAWLYVGLAELQYLGIFMDIESAQNKIEEELQERELTEEEYQEYISLSIVEQLSQEQLNEVFDTVRKTILNDEDFIHSFNREERTIAFEDLASEVAECVVDELECFTLTKRYIDHSFQVIDGQIIVNYDDIMVEFEDRL